MKKVFIAITMLAAAFAISCQEKNLSTWEKDSQENPSGTLFVNLIVPGGSATKVLGSSTDESAVNTLQIFVFKQISNSDHSLNIRETDKWVADGSTSVSLNAFMGKKIVWALVNAPRQSFNNEEELMNHYSKLEENSPTNLVMAGNATVDVAEYNASASVGAITPVPITVSHLGVRISIRNVKLDFANTSLEGCFFDVKEVYILNAVNSVALSGTARAASELGPSASCWYNLEAWNNSTPDAAKAILGDRGNLGITIGPTSGTQDLNRFFYVYPNVSLSENDNTDATPSARLTRMILHGYIRGTAGRNAGDNIAHAEESYYCFDIPKSNTGATLERNHTYDIENVTITMPGGPSDSPEDRPKYGKVNATVTVGEWGGHTILNYEL